MPNYSSLRDGQNYTREIYAIDQNTGKSSYAGYGSFTRDSQNGDRYNGSRGGYNTPDGQNRNNGASRVGNTILTSGARQAAARARATRGTNVRL